MFNLLMDCFQQRPGLVATRFGCGGTDFSKDIPAASLITGIISMAPRAHQRRRLTFAINKVAFNSHGWATLLPELLLLILRRLPIKDYLRFGAVCVSWNRLVTEKLVSPAPRLPWLIADPVGSNLPLVMFDPFINKVEECWARFQERGCFLGSSSDGYMLLFQEKTSHLLVVNPLTGSHIPLPSINTLPGFNPWIFNAALWCPTSSAVSVVAIAYGCYYLAFSRAGDKKWSLLGKSDHMVHDIIFFKGLLYVTTHRGAMSLDCQMKNPPMQEILNPEEVEHQRNMSDNFLVQSSTGSDLLQVRINSLKPIEILKLDLAGTPKWCRVTRLCGDDALMLSPHRSVCISAREFPVLRGNCIYSTLHRSVAERNKKKGYSPLRVYSLDDGSMEYAPLPRRKLGPTPDWFTPYLW